MQFQNNLEILQYFLNMPMDDATQIYELFAVLPGAVVGKGDQPLQRFVFIPGTRKDAVVLVAHTDTVWDQRYGKPARGAVLLEDGVFRSSDPACGIGADDRAGCAMLWALRNSGHSILIVDGEEKGKHGAQYLRQHHKALFRQLNRHRFMMEFDWQGTDGCLYNQVENTQDFKDYIADRLGFQDSKQKGGCDLQILCQKICGVNIGVGYHNCHRPTETLVVEEWEHTYDAVSAFLQKEQVKFSIPTQKQIRAFLRRCKGKCGQILRKLHLKK